mmetsp:Transcript_12092/g.20070  ORF Transcript_12092/g.20070 Transcript_12092/m.20070 type:complete len:203 (+) Transcript_12092:636-1244(+)
MWILVGKGMDNSGTRSLMTIPSLSFGIELVTTTRRPTYAIRSRLSFPMVPWRSLVLVMEDLTMSAFVTEIWIGRPEVPVEVSTVLTVFQPLLESTVESTTTTSNSDAFQRLVPSMMDLEEVWTEWTGWISRGTKTLRREPWRLPQSVSMLVWTTLLLSSLAFPWTRSWPVPVASSWNSTSPLPLQSWTRRSMPNSLRTYHLA